MPGSRSASRRSAPRRSGRRAGAFAALCALAGSPGPAASQEAAEAATLAAVAVDAADGNRFLTRVGGTVRDDVTDGGLVAGQPCTLAARLLTMTTQAPEGEVALVPFTPEASGGHLSVEVPVPPNRTEANIDYVVVLTLYEGQVDEGGAGGAGGATPVAQLSDAADLEQTIQVHAVQGISVRAADAADGDNALPAEGGAIRASVEHVNLVPGYGYTVWGQLLTPSGQSTGLYASVAEYVPEARNGSVAMEFTVPASFEGLRLVPAVGLFHRNRVSLDADGWLTQLPDAPNPVMIASDLSLDAAEQTVDVGTPFEDLAAGDGEP